MSAPSGETRRPADPSPTFDEPETPLSPGGDRLERLRRLLAGGLPPAAKPLLETATTRAERIRAAIGDGEGGATIAATAFTADVLAALAVEGALQAHEAHVAVGALADACSIDPEAARFNLYVHTTTASPLIELPPTVTAGIQLGLLVQLGVAKEVSLWRITPGGRLESLLQVGGPSPSPRMRTEAIVTLQERSFRLFRRGGYRSSTVLRFGHPHAAVVARLPEQAPGRVEAYLEEAAAALGPVLEREYLLERSTMRERALVATGERRLMRLGFDLHDGPIQEVLALAAEVRHLRDQAHPFVLESHREKVFGRFDDILLRLVEVDRQLREIAHSLESRSIVSRPLGEILHREVDAFTERSGIECQLELYGDSESLTSAQRIAVFRAIQEALANVREHSGATRVEINMRARRSSIDVRIVDNGVGFEVERAIARAAERGRLGLVGIGERVRMLGGTFEIRSEHGGPTTLAFSLPRWEPLGQAQS